MTSGEKHTGGRNAGLAGEVAAVAERLQQATVQVRGEGPGAGSGVIWRSNGLIVTNAHVARGTRATVELWDKRTLSAEVTARDTARDLAALTVEGAGFPAATAANSDALRVGEFVLAVGHPLGLVGAVTTGIIHAVGAAPGERQRWVVADLRLAPGNSGGPLADARGRVVGINSMVSGGLALAVPSNAVERFLRGLAGHKPFLGVTTRPVEIAVNGTRSLGFLVLEIAPSSPAAASGLLIGDVLVGAGGAIFASPEDLGSMLSDAEPGDTLPIDVVRAGRLVTVRAVLTGAGAAEAQAA